MKRLYSVHVLAEQRWFAGKFRIAKAGYMLRFTPGRAEMIEDRFQLVGNLKIEPDRGEPRSKEGVRAVLAGTQGGLGAAPARPDFNSLGIRRAQDIDRAARLSETEFTGPNSFVGVMYYHLDALNSANFRVPADLSRVQLNVRFAPTDDVAHRLQGLYGGIVEAMFGETRDRMAAEVFLRELNRILTAGS
jgi:hypothetical protein